MKNEIKEEFREVKEFEGLYKISNLGRVYSLYSNRVITPRLQRGYCKINLYKDNVCHTKQVHRLVAIAFLPNPNDLPYVNHIDENKTNNVVDNLEWISHLDNVNHGTAIARRTAKACVSVEQYSKDGKFIARYNSVKEAGAAVNGSPGNISSVLNGRRKTAYGYKWKYSL